MALYDPKAESHYLGALLIQSAAGWAPDKALSPDLFYQQEIADAVRAWSVLRGQGRPANEIAIEAITGNGAVLREAVSETVDSQALDDYAEQVREAARRRRLDAEAQELRRLAANDTADLDRELPVRADRIASLRRQTTVDDVASEADKAAQRVYEWVQDKTKLLGRTTGITELDRYTDGLRSLLYIIGARPNMGKTGIMLQCLDGQQRRGLHVVCVTLEQNIGPMIERIAWQRMEMPASAVQPGSQELANFMAHVADIRDSQNITWYSGLRSRDPHSIIGAILDAHRRRPVDCVWIDHIGKIAHVGERNESLPTRIGHTSEALANLALRLDAPVMALCQLNREAADGEPPQLTDLRDSGALEQDARFVWMPHRPGYYMDPRPPKNRPQVLDIYQRKVQDGNADTIGLMWRDDCARIYPRKFGA